MLNRFRVLHNLAGVVACQCLSLFLFGLLGSGIWLVAGVKCGASLSPSWRSRPEERILASSSRSHHLKSSFLKEKSANRHSPCASRTKRRLPWLYLRALQAAWKIKLGACCDRSESDAVCLPSKELFVKASGIWHFILLEVKLEDLNGSRRKTPLSLEDVGELPRAAICQSGVHIRPESIAFIECLRAAH